MTTPISIETNDTEENINMLPISEYMTNQNEEVASNSNHSVTWKMFGHNVPRSEVVYICQMIIITGVIISCIVNLSLKNGNAEMWVSFFGYAFGAMLPPPKIKRVLARNSKTLIANNSSNDSETQL